LYDSVKTDEGIPVAFPAKAKAAGTVPVPDNCSLPVFKFPPLDHVPPTY